MISGYNDHTLNYRDMQGFTSTEDFPKEKENISFKNVQANPLITHNTRDFFVFEEDQNNICIDSRKKVKSLQKLDDFGKNNADGNPNPILKSSRPKNG